MITTTSAFMVAIYMIACITPTNSVPTRVYLTIIQIEINSNDMSMVSSTSPTYGHIVLNITPSIYAGYVTNVFPIPVNSGLDPTIA